MIKNALSTILAELRVSGAIVLSQAHPIPWSIRVPQGNALRGYLGVGDDVTVVPFHIAHRGHFDLHPVDGKSMVVDANQLVMCANGKGHVMSSGKAGETRSFEDVMLDGSFESQQNGVGHTEVVCGVFMLRNTRNNPLIMALPDFVLVDVYGSQSSPTMQQLHAILKDELQRSRHAQSYMLERVLELLYAESIRIFSEQRGDDTPGWLTAINDHRVGPSINYIHAHLAKDITVEDLAAQAALSPSRFSACFKALIGLSPKAYLAMQRQAQAARLLLETGLSVQEIAFRCGYRSIPSFNKSFVRQFGCTPSTWRKKERVKI